MSGLPFGNAPTMAQQKDRIQWASDSLLDDSSETASQFSNQSFSRFGSTTLRAPDIGVRMRNLYKSEKFADVKFIIKGAKKSKSSLLAHKAILAVGSTKFEEMLFGPASACMSPKAMLEIEINNVSFGAFRNIVEYLYTDEVYFENDSIVLETLISAKKFEIQSLMDKCESFFESRELSEDNVCSMLNLSVNNKMEALKSRCIQFIQENTCDVLRTQNFLESNLTTVRAIFKLQQLRLRSEAELFEAAMKWSYGTGASNHRSQTEPLLKCIRFLTMTPNDFSTLVQQYPNVLSAKEALDIVMFLTNPPREGAKSVNLPTWCNKETRNRCFIRAAAALNSSFADLSLSTDRVDKLTIALQPFNNPQKLDALKSFLEMRCTGGRHQINAVKLRFQEPVTEKSCIGYLLLRIQVFPSGFKHEERIRIQSSSEVIVKLKRTPLARTGDIIRIEADAKEVQNYKFFQFDPNKPSISAPFDCTIASMPKWEKLYFISEVHYGPQVPPAFRRKR